MTHGRSWDMRVIIFPCPIHYRASSVKSVPVAHPGTDGMGAPEEGLGAKPLPRYGRAGGQSLRWGNWGRSPPQKLKPKNTLDASRKRFGYG